MSRRSDGFTVPEIIVVIVVLGILAAAGIFAWNGVQTWSQNKTRENELSQWVNTFELYKSRYAFYPGAPEGSDGGGSDYVYCLGDFSASANKCGEYTSSNATHYRHATGPDPDGLVAEEIRSELAKVGKTPSNSAPPIDNRVIGPYVAYSKSTAASTVTITADFISLFKDSSCPDGTTEAASAPIGSAMSGVIACKITKTLQYNTP